jgi:hypothetical protein
VIQPIEDDLVCHLNISRTRTWLYRYEKSYLLCMKDPREIALRFNGPKATCLRRLAQRDRG